MDHQARVLRADGGQVIELAAHDPAASRFQDGRTAFTLVPGGAQPGDHITDLCSGDLDVIIVRTQPDRNGGGAALPSAGRGA
jgi:hypothetical protein